MILWSIQPESSLKQLEETGVYRCDPSLSINISKPDSLKEHYKWLMMRMRDKIGNEPEGVTYPIWAGIPGTLKENVPIPTALHF